MQEYHVSMADDSINGGLRRKRRRLARKEEVEERPVEKADVHTIKASSPSYGFLHMISLIIEHDIPIIFPGSERPRNAYGLLGAGASFLVFKEERNMNDVIMRHGKRRSLEDKVVLKRTRQFYDLDSSSKDNLDRRYHSVISELQILLDLFVQESEHIIDLHGLTWDFEPDGDGNHTVWPVIALEAAELSMQALKVEFDLSDAPLHTRVEYCYHVAQGLDLLHSRGVVHCDLKLENVLICVTERSGTVAKLCDFGSAVIGVDEQSLFRFGLAGTPPWTAPEYRQPLQGLDTFKIDVYAFGMLLWRFMLKSTTLNIFEEAIGRDRAIQLEKLEKMKLSNEVIALAEKELRDAFESSPVLDLVIEILTRTLVSGPGQRCSMDVIVALLARAVQAGSDVDAVSESEDPLKGQRLTEAADQAGSEEDIDESLVSELDDIPAKVLPVSIEPFFNEFERVYEIFEDESTPVKAHVFNCLRLCADDEQKSTSTAAEAAYQLVLCCANGFGTQKDPLRAWEWMKKAARMQNLKAQAQAYSYFKGILPTEQPSPPAMSETLSWLESATCHGSIEAARHLRYLDKARFEQTIPKWEKRFCEINTKLDGEHIEPDTEDIADSVLGRLHEYTPDVILNTRGSRSIHLAASLGNVESLQVILGAGIDVNSMNSRGETALLCACRSNEPRAALLLLDWGAHAEPAYSGESPLHWLIAIEGSNLAMLANKLVHNGADLEQKYKLTEDNGLIFDIYPHGTPLDWAVSKRNLEAITQLIRLGADPFNECSGFSPLTRATSSHDWEVLNILLASKFVTPDKFRSFESTGHSVLFEAIYCHEFYDRILLHGPDLRKAAVNTVRALVEAGSDPSCLEQDGSTILHVLAGFCDFDFCSWFLEAFEFKKFINTVSGQSERVPIHNAMASGNYAVFKLLVEQGADTYVKTFSLTLLHLLALSHAEGFALLCLEALEPESRKDLGLLGKFEEPFEGSLGGLTAFELAVHSSNLKIADRLLLAGGNDIEVESRDLHFMASLITLPNWTSLRSLEYYLEKVECPFIVRRSTSLSVLHLAASMFQHLADTNTSEQKLDLLISRFQRNDQINAVTTATTSFEVAAGQTALHYAAKFGVSYAARKLLLAGAASTIRDSNRHTPLDLARMQLESVKQKLLDHTLAFSELQSTVKILEQAQDLDAIRTSKIAKSNPDIRTQFSMLGFRTQVID